MSDDKGRGVLYRPPWSIVESARIWQSTHAAALQLRKERNVYRKSAQKTTTVPAGRNPCADELCPESYRQTRRVAPLELQARRQIPISCYKHSAPLDRISST